MSYITKSPIWPYLIAEVIINKHVVFHGLSVDHPPSAVMTDDTPFATAFHAAAPKGHRKMKGEPHEKFENISQ